MNFMENIATLASAHEENLRYIYISFYDSPSLPNFFLLISHSWDPPLTYAFQIPSVFPPLSLARVTPSTDSNSCD
jgi:hypothetical protein